MELRYSSMHLRTRVFGSLLRLAVLIVFAFPAGGGVRAAPEAGTLLWNTFLGGGDFEAPRGMARDASGNIYLIGRSNSNWGAPVNAFSGYQDAFVAKLDSNGNLIWNTFLGGNFFDEGIGIAVDVSGNIYAAGWSPASWGSPINGFAGGYSDGWVAKLNSSGARLWNTFLGGSGLDWGTGVAVDASGNLYIAGGGTATWGTPIKSFSGGYSDAFMLMLNNGGARMWNTFLGGGGEDDSNDIAIDAGGNLYVVGRSDAAWGSPVHAYTSGDDAYAAKLNSGGTRLWNTFMGAAGDDVANDAMVDAAGNLYLAGKSASTWGPPVNPIAAGGDAFAAKLNTGGVRLWNTFMGGGAADEGFGITVDTSGNVYVAGQSGATWGPPLTGYAGGASDAFVAALRSTGKRVWNTFMGGGGADTGWDVVVDRTRNLYVAGNSPASWGSPIDPFAAGDDAFLAKRPGISARSFRSAGALDGWVLESNESSNLGGPINVTAATLNLGDDAADRQFRSILSYNTGVIPDNAVILSVRLKLRSAGVVGMNPFLTHGNLLADVRKGAFSGNGALQALDFQAAPSKVAALSFTNKPINGWYVKAMAPADFTYINKAGVTQFRLRFALDDNNDLSADYLKISSGNAAVVSSRPLLVVEYYVP